MRERKQSLVLVPRRLSLLIGAALFGGWPGPAAYAACVTSGTSTTCNTSAPNPATTPIGQGPATASGASVTLQPNAQLAVGNANTISLGDNATIFLGAGAVVSNTATSGAGLWTAGNNTVEFGSNGMLTVSAGAKIQALGTQANGEAVNVMGAGNTILNYGLISGGNAAAIWFEDRSKGAANTVDNYGIIQAGNGTSSNVIGNSGSGNVSFINRSGAAVRGSLTFASGNDSLTLYPGSIITGGFNGGGGTNSLSLAGELGSSDTLPGTISNFQSLIKTGDGKWTLSGAVGSNGGGTPLAVQVQDGTLALTGNNAGFNGSVRVDPAGTLEARAQSLPPSVTNNGLVLFNQPDNGTYAGTISGTGSVSKIAAGVLTLSGSNTYQGGTRIQGGTVAVGADSALGAGSGGVTLDGGALAFNSSFTLGSDRAVSVTANNGTLSANAGVTSTLTQAITGAGALTKDGAGTILLTSNANSWAGGACHRRRHAAIGQWRRLGQSAGRVRHRQQRHAGLQSQRSVHLRQPRHRHRRPQPDRRRRRPDRQQQLRRPDLGDGRRAVRERYADRRGSGHGGQWRHAGRIGTAGRQCHGPVRRHAGARRCRRGAGHADGRRRPDLAGRVHAGVFVWPGRRGGRPVQ